MAELPAYLFQILDKELYDMHVELMKKVANEYGLDHDELVSKFLVDPLQLTPATKTKIEITKRMNPAPPAPDDVRCVARVWNRGNGKQCSRKRTDGSDLCAHHQSMLEKNGQLRHGRIEETPPATVFSTTTKRKALYK